MLIAKSFELVVDGQLPGFAVYTRDEKEMELLAVYCAKLIMQLMERKLTPCEG